MLYFLFFVFLWIIKDYIEVFWLRKELEFIFCFYLSN